MDAKVCKHGCIIVARGVDLLEIEDEDAAGGEGVALREAGAEEGDALIIEDVERCVLREGFAETVEVGGLRLRGAVEDDGYAAAFGVSREAVAAVFHGELHHLAFADGLVSLAEVEEGLGEVVTLFLSGVAALGGEGVVVVASPATREVLAHEAVTP